MKSVLVISYADSIDGAQGSLRLATKYWSNDLGWEIDVIHPHLKKFENAFDLLNVGMNPIEKVPIGKGYEFVLINSVLNIEWAEIIKNTPMVLWIHEGYSMLSVLDPHQNLVKNLFSKLSSVLISTEYQAVVIYKEYLRNVAREKIHLVPYSIESLNKSYPKRERTDSDPFVISWLGSIIPRKRPMDLVWAGSILKNLINMRIEFIGPLIGEHQLAKEFSQIRHLQNSRITWHDALPHDQALELISKSDVFCFTSEDESTGLAPLEAASLNIPVVLANLPIYQYIGWKDQHNCLMYPVKDIEQLKNCILKVHNDKLLVEKMTRNAYLLAQEFHPSKFLEKITNAVSIKTKH